MQLLLLQGDVQVGIEAHEIDGLAAHRRCIEDRFGGFLALRHRQGDIRLAHDLFGALSSRVRARNPEGRRDAQLMAA